ncbi:unnamed protein product, partial [Medioppia subpectinata]
IYLTENDLDDQADNTEPELTSDDIDWALNDPGFNFESWECESDPDTSLCRAYFNEYYCNSTSGRCEPFIYGGCGANNNHFETHELCLDLCADYCHS